MNSYIKILKKNITDEAVKLHLNFDRPGRHTLKTTKLESFSDSLMGSKTVVGLQALQTIFHGVTGKKPKNEIQIKKCG